MPVRGQKPIWPNKGGKPTGIFSTNGKQKQDGISGPNMDLLKYAHSGGGDKGGHKADTAQGKRHQQHYGSNPLGHSKASKKY